MPRRTPLTEPLRSPAGAPLTRPVGFRFALDPTAAQEAAFRAHAGAARLVYNFHLARVTANLSQREAERSYGIPEERLTPALSWSWQSFVNDVNRWKNGKAPDSPVNADGSRGLAWRREVSADVFTTASVDAAQALANFLHSRDGTSRRRGVRFPRFKAKSRTRPAFRLMNRDGVGAVRQRIRVAGPKALHLPTLGELRIHGCTRTLRRLLAAGRCHLFSATISYRQGRWWIGLRGVAAQFHPQRRAAAGRHPRAAGLDRGLASLAVVADDQGDVLRTVEAVRALRDARPALHRADKGFSRTQEGSAGRRKAKARQTRLHARAAHRRASVAHELSSWLATRLARLTIEDLSVAAMMRGRRLGSAVTDAAMSELARQVRYKAGWYGLELVVADRWFPSSKTCSGCDHVKADLARGERTYRCGQCGLVLDRDVNAAVNLARWAAPSSPPRSGAA